MEFQFGIKKYNQLFDVSLSVETSIRQKLLTTLSSKCIISADIDNDIILSSIGAFFSNSYGTYGTENALHRMISRLEANVSDLSVKTATIMPLQNQFEVMRCPTASESNLASDEAGRKPDTDAQNDILKSYNDLFSLYTYQKIPSDNITNDASQLITHSYTTIKDVFKTIFPHTAIGTNAIITSHTFYEFLLQLATVLERTKVLKYSFNYKVTQFFGKMAFHKCLNVYPELPINDIKYTDLMSFYSAVLVSPFAKHFNVNWFDNVTGFDRYGSTTFNQLDNQALSWNFDDLDLRDHLVFISDSIKSDEPTFDIMSKDGSNGEFKQYKIITNNTYNLKDQIADIVEMFEISSGQIISAKKILQVLIYIFQLWHQNLQVFQYDIYACHYNCHINNFDGNSGITDEYIQSKAYTVKCFINDYIFDLENNFNAYLKPLLSLTDYVGTYYYVFKTTDAALLKTKNPVVSYTLPYPIWNQENEHIDAIPLSAYCIINTDDHGEICINLPEKFEIAFGQKETRELKIQHLITSDNKDQINNSNIRSDNILSAVGNIEFNFCYYYEGQDNRTDLESLGKGAITFAEGEEEGEIYFDLTKTYSGKQMSQYFNMAGNIMTDRGNKVFRLFYQPTPHLSLKPAVAGEPREIIITDDNTDYQVTYSNSDHVGTAWVTVTATGTNKHYKGSLRQSYQIKALPKRNFSELTAQFDKIPPIAGYTLPVAAENIPKLVLSEKSGTPIPTDMYQLTYKWPEGGESGMVRVTATPTDYDTTGKYGDSYYVGEKYMEFKVVKPASSARPTTGKNVCIGRCVLDWDDGTSDDAGTMDPSADAKQVWDKGSHKYINNATLNLPSDCPSEFWLSITVYRQDDKHKLVCGVVMFSDQNSNVLGTIPYAIKLASGRENLKQSIRCTISDDSMRSSIKFSAIITGSNHSVACRRVIEVWVTYESTDSVPMEGDSDTSYDDVVLLTFEDNSQRAIAALTAEQLAANVDTTGTNYLRKILIGENIKTIGDALFPAESAEFYSFITNIDYEARQITSIGSSAFANMGIYATIKFDNIKQKNGVKVSGYPWGAPCTIEWKDS